MRFTTGITPRPTNLPILPTSSPSMAPPPPPLPPAPSNPHGYRDFPLPKLRLEARDLLHPGAGKFLFAVTADKCMHAAIHNIFRLLYVSPKQPDTNLPPTRSVTLILRDMDGVAYTTGSDLDNDHKEIHMSLSYINGIGHDRVTSEIEGVVTHELVHCYQHNAKGTCPGGLIEGIADWVRLKCGLKPPHWDKDKSGSWDGGYQKTGYFLDFLEESYGEGTVRRINETLREDKYNEAAFWHGLFGKTIEELWTDYGGEAAAPK